MRLHTKLTHEQIHRAMDAAKSSGRVDSEVWFDKIDAFGSRKRDRAFEIKLRWDGVKEKGDGRRWTNSGNRGADSEANGGDGHYAATYDEWGWFIAELFSQDPEAIFGTYDGIKGFEAATQSKFILK